MVLDPDVKEILEDHGNRLDIHDVEITDLKVGFAKLDKGQENIDKSMNRLENTVLTTQNSILSTLNQFVDNTTKKQIAEYENDTKREIAKGDNRRDIIIKVLWIGGSLLTGLLAGSKFLS